VTVQPALLPADPQSDRPVVRCVDYRRPLYRAQARAVRRGERCQLEHFAARGFAVEQETLPGLADGYS
jgi:hypothetical protein